MSQNIRLATIEDMPKILELIKELALFENEHHQVKINVDELSRDGFENQPAFNCFIGEINGEVKGMALVYKRYSTWKGVVLHLEDLIVSQDARGLGLGTKLLDEVVKYGNQLGVKRVSWEVLDWNEQAIALYEKKGAKILRDWNVVQLDEQGIKNYLSNL
jgi:ribosomal protein S18 acetylase RimI-like enzyme